MFHDFTAGNKLRRPKQKQLEEGKLSGCQRDCPFIARGAAAVTVECKVRVTKLRVGAVEAPPNERPQRARSSAKTKGFVR